MKTGLNKTQNLVETNDVCNKFCTYKSTKKVKKEQNNRNFGKILKCLFAFKWSVWLPQEV